jgi:hypothetical protein
MLAMYACTPASPSDLGSDAGLRAFRGTLFPALAELVDLAFGAAGSTAAFVGSEPVTAGTSEVGWTSEDGIAAPRSA